jgi:hypothetical protein
VKSCGTPLRPADLLAGDGLGIGAQAGACNADFGLNVCQDVGTLARCLVAEHSRGAARLFASEQPRASELIAQALAVSVPDLPEFPGCQDCSQAPSDTTGKAVTACGAAVTKAGRTFAAAVGKGLGTCIDTVFACLQIKAADPKCLAKARSTCDATAGEARPPRAQARRGDRQEAAPRPRLVPFATLAGTGAQPRRARRRVRRRSASRRSPPSPTTSPASDASTSARSRACCANTLPRTTELLDAGFLGGAGDLLDAAACPASLPSEALRCRRAPDAARRLLRASRSRASSDDQEELAAAPGRRRRPCPRCRRRRRRTPRAYRVPAGRPRPLRARQLTHREGHLRRHHEVDEAAGRRGRGGAVR